MTEIVLAEMADDFELPVLPFVGNIHFKEDGQEYYCDGALALRSKYVKVPCSVEVKTVKEPEIIKKAFDGCVPLELLLTIKDRHIFKGLKGEKPFYVMISGHYMAMISAFSKEYKLRSNSPLSPVIIDACVENPEFCDCNCEYCDYHDKEETIKHFIGIVMPMNYSRFKFCFSDFQKKLGEFQKHLEGAECVPSA